MNTTPTLYGIAYNGETRVLLLWGFKTPALVAEWNYGHLMIGLRDKRYSHWNYSEKYGLSVPKEKVISTKNVKTEPKEIRWHEGRLTQKQALERTL
jgi:hypothetical protein